MQYVCLKLLKTAQPLFLGIKWDLQNLSIEYFWQVFVYRFKIPLEVEIREACDQGHPIVLAAPDSVVSRAYGNIAEKVVQKLKEKQFQPEILLWNVSLCRHNTPVQGFAYF